MGQDHALGAAGGARRVGQHSGVGRAVGRAPRRCGRGGEQVASAGDVDALGRVQRDDRVRREPGFGSAARARSRNGEMVNSSLAPESASWWASSLGGVERVRAGHDGVGAQDAVEHHGVLRRVGREERDDVALDDAPLVPARRRACRHRRELGEGDQPPGAAVDERGRVGPVAEVAEEELGQRDLGDLDVRVRAADRHGGAPLRRRRPDHASPARSVGTAAQATATWPAEAGMSEASAVRAHLRDGHSGGDHLADAHYGTSPCQCIGLQWPGEERGVCRRCLQPQHSPNSAEVRHPQHHQSRERSPGYGES